MGSLPSNNRNVSYLLCVIDVFTNVGKLKTVPADLKKVSDIVNNVVVKNREFNTI